MTAFDRFEARLPELMTDLAAPRVPDYVDDMLGQARQTRQKPAWASLERWLPVSVTGQTARVRASALRPIVLFVVLALLIVAGLVLYAASQPRLPEPFGPAHNGLLLVRVDDPARGYDGDILAIDPETSSATTLIEGPTEGGPIFSNDGRRFLFVRDHSLLVANPDGSGIRELIADFGPITGVDWSPRGDRVLEWSGIASSPFRPPTILDVDTGKSSTSLDPGISYNSVYWRPNTEQLVLRADLAADPSGQAQGLYLVNADGTGLQTIGEWPYKTWRVMVSPDGSTIAFWEQGTDNAGLPHIVDIETGQDRRLDFSGEPIQFSPDGSNLLAYGSVIANGGAQLAMLPLDGEGPAVPVGPEGMCCFEAALLSPDGTKVLAQFSEGDDLADRSTWLFDVGGGEAHQLADLPNAQISMDPRQWQRLTP